jgi:hypothetical protein
MSRQCLLDEESVDVLEHRLRRSEPVQDGPRCPWPRMTPPPPAGPPIEPPVTHVSDATWEAERRRRIDARPPPPRDDRRAVAVALNAEYVDQDTASAACPICAGVLALRFRGELVELDCCDGCAPDDVQQAVAVIA